MALQGGEDQQHALSSGLFLEMRYELYGSFAQNDL